MRPSHHRAPASKRQVGKVPTRALASLVMDLDGTFRAGWQWPLAGSLRFGVANHQDPRSREICSAILLWHHSRGDHLVKSLKDQRDDRYGTACPYMIAIDGKPQARTVSMTRLLLVDDDADLAAMLADYLSREGFSVEVANDGQTGLERAI